MESGGSVPQASLPGLILSARRDGPNHSTFTQLVLLVRIGLGVYLGVARDGYRVNASRQPCIRPSLGVLRPCAGVSSLSDAGFDWRSLITSSEFKSPFDLVPVSGTVSAEQTWLDSL